MPAPLKDRDSIFIRSTHFYALSWLIQSLGEWKDIGLSAMAFHDLGSELKTGISTAEKKFLSACKISPKDVSAYAENACDEFLYRDRVLANIKRDLLRCTNHAE
jgi:hypothetical protein